jgi:acyl carrier protein
MARKNLKTRPAPAPPPEWEGSHKILADIIAQQMGIDLAEVTKDATFIDDLGFDSLDGIEVIMQIEEELGVDLDEAQFMDLKTVGEMLPKLDEVIAAKAAEKSAKK